ncbi:MAG: tRNA pseudouridine(55) synthase TruB [Phototrophicales bacterium]|nr:MAG: tRNA pseudouridine(55) synthase TruB [Phototrophicales bacterium]
MLGFLNIDKPLGMTSHDVVARVRRRARQLAGHEVKVGHAGTLDPLASGVLVVCLGAAARLSDEVMHTTKRYRAVVHFGVTTETDDGEGDIIEVRSLDGVDESAIRDALDNFVGEIDQIPPMYSAIKQGGRKLYDLARAGKTVERAARRVRIDALTLLDWHPPQAVLDVICGSGTYIRSLARDLGENLSCGAHLAALTRTAVGALRLEDSAQLDDLLAAESWDGYIITPRAALTHWTFCRVNAAQASVLRHGRAIRQQHQDAEQLLIEDESGALIALVRAKDGCWKPEKVFG